MKTAACAAALALLAAGCSGDDPAKKPLPPAISLGAPPGGMPAGGGGMPTGHPPTGGGMPPGHPPMGGGGMEAPAPKPRPAPVPDGKFKGPEGWQPEEPASSMRAAQFRLPRADGDAKDGEVAVFGNSMGGTKANIDRWRGQFSEVAAGKDALEEITEGVQGKITILDITGKFSGGMAPGGGPGMAAAHGGAEADGGTTRMLAAVIEAKGGTYYVKATGSPGTVGKWEKSIRDYILGLAK